MSHRLITLLSVVAILTIAPNSQAQWEEKVGKTLFQNAIFPCAAGPGKVAFLRMDEKIPGMPLEMYLGDIKTKTETRALPGFDFNEMPQYAYAWSPDGSEFVKPEKSGGCWELSRYKAGSRTGEKLTKLIEFRDKLTRQQMDELDVSEDMLLSISEIAYSPSGKRLIFSMNRYTKNAVWWFEFSSGKTRQATPDRIGYYGSAFPDDDHLCYTDPVIKEGITTDEDIMVRSLTTGDVDTLTHSRNMEFSGVISLDGKYMVYIITDNNVNNLHVMKMATRESKQFTFAPVGKNCTCPRWSPDGRQIFFQGSGFYPRPAVMVKDFTPF